MLEIDKDIDDKWQRYKYILNIIDHFTKFTGSYLLERKSAQEVLYSINDFILRNDKPQIIQADNGREFKNNLLNEYCNKNEIKIIHSRPRHPSTNGVVERVHQNIRKALLSIKLEKNENYDIRMAIAYAENAQNSCRHSVTKYIPKEIFSNSNEFINNNVRNNMMNSQKNINKNVDKLEKNTYVLISNIYEKKGNKLSVKYNNIGIRNIPGIIVDNNSYEIYKVKILINYKDLIKFNIYDINYPLIKSVTKEIYDKLIKENLLIDSKDKIESLQFNNINSSEKINKNKKSYFINEANNKEKNDSLGDIDNINKLINKDININYNYNENENIVNKEINKIDEEFLSDITSSSIIEEEDSFEYLLDNSFN